MVLSAWIPIGYHARDIHLHESWVKVLNPISGSVKLLEALLDDGIQKSNYTAELSISNHHGVESDMTNRYFSSIVSQLFAKAVVNGFSRIGA